MNDESTATANQRHIFGEAEHAPPAGADWLSRLDRWLYFTVHDSGLPVSPLGAVIAILGIGLLLGGALFVVYENELISAVAAAIGALGALFGGIALVIYRRQQVATQVPRWVDVLARSLRAGQSLEHSLRVSLQKLTGPLARDLRRCTDRLALGLRINEAFQDLGLRYRSLDLQMVISALAMHSQSGGDLPTTLERLAAVAQQRLEYRRQTQAASSTARFAAICLAIAPPLIFAYYWYTNQFMGSFLSDPSGQFALALAVGLELIGLAWLLYLSRTEV
jgi:tight adherence protein B